MARSNDWLIGACALAALATSCGQDGAPGAEPAAPDGGSLHDAGAPRWDLGGDAGATDLGLLPPRDLGPAADVGHLAADAAPPADLALAADLADLAFPCDAGPSADAGGAADLGGGGCPTDAVAWLTVNRIPPTMNGSRPFTNSDGLLEPYRLLLPPQGFTLDVMLPVGAGALPELLGLGCGEWDGLAAAQRTEDGWSVQVPAAAGLAESPGVRCWARLQPGCAAAPQDLELWVGIATLSPELDPFERAETWLLCTQRDHWSVELELLEGGGLRLVSSAGANGVADLDDALLALGLASDDTAPGAAEVAERGVQGVSAVFRRRLLDGMVRELRSIFDQEPDGTFGPGAIPIHFALQGDPGAPDPMDFDPNGEFSMMGIGGRDEDDRNVGRARIDWGNRSQQDNATDPTLGIFTSSLVSMFLDHPLAVVLLGSFVPALGGVPLGQAALDAALFAPDFDASQVADPALAQRATLVLAATELLGRGLAALVAHEMGHSLGLVPYGPPPAGLFAGELRGEFVAGPATDAHINTEGFNLMQQGFTLQGMGMELLSARPRFNELNMAYLQGRLVVDPRRPREPALAPEESAP